MEKINIKNRNLSLIEKLIDVWEKSVRETHLFLSNKEIDEIKNFVPMALKLVPHLIIESDANGVPIAFMGIDDRKLEMLFIDPRERGKGLGRKLLEHGITNYGVKEVVVNEQNPQAKGFYEHMGFKVYEGFEIYEQKIFIQFYS